MPKATEYTSGWVDTTMHDFLSAMDTSPGSRYALITCLDSCFDLAPVVDANPKLQELKRRGKLEIIGDSISLATRDLLEAQRQRRLFFGFDELWFGSNAAKSAKPADIVITTGPDRISDRMLPALIGSMEANHCSIGLGDGVGMNFCAKLTGPTRRLADAFADAALGPVSTYDHLPRTIQQPS